MKIVKASAGSGKTYRLSETYRTLLLNSKEANPHRHILAVTFTNKATAEMKSRILKDLAEDGKTNPHAKEVLENILHDYGAFAISTIDKFFQSTLKAFSREIGQFADYQIELDRPSVINEAMDRILDSLSEDQKDLVEWIKSSVSDKMQFGEKLDIDKALHEMGAMLKSEEHRELAEKFGIDDLKAYDKTRLVALSSNCQSIIQDFEKKALELGVVVKKGTRIERPGKKALSASADLLNLFGTPYKNYCTAFIIRNLIFSLGVAGEFYKEFDTLLKEKNIMCLDESNSILKGIIDGSDAPFIYEKLGVRFDNFLLDEFQDTSGIQWENFRPLLCESEANGKECLIVGDIKQSIYRWRNSDWNLLGSKIAEQFPTAKVEVLENNWRSTANVVGFNNEFFEYAAYQLGLNSLYSDVRQQVKSNDSQKGQVRVSFTDNQMQAVLQSIRNAQENGAQLNDIAVLVRSNDCGSEIAKFLIDNGIPVVSDDSLKVKSSVVVRRVVSLLCGMENPKDTVNKYLADSLGLEYPTEYHSILDLCESLLRYLRDKDSVSFDKDTSFIQAYMDAVRDWTSINGNNLRGFLEFWKDCDISIASPEDSSAVRIMTIHKSKGLEFPHVIFPFAHKVTMFKANTVHWCHLDTKGTPFIPEADGLYPVSLSGKTLDTHFDDAYREEFRQEVIDNINVFYVALTRAEKSLHIIAEVPSKKCKEAVKKSDCKNWSNFSELLYAFCGGLDEFSKGEQYDYSKIKRLTHKEEAVISSFYPSFELDGRLAPSSDAEDFFGEDGVVGAQASPRLAGIVLHDILSQTIKASDLGTAIDFAVADGRIALRDATNAMTLLSKAVSAHPEWFPEDGSVIYNETGIIGSDGSEYRPDRVVVRPDGKVLIVDYKFGAQSPGHIRQVGEYVDLYRKMGYSDVSGAIWYVRSDMVIPAMGSLI